MGEHEWLLEATELGNIVFECVQCGCRVCVSATGTLNEDDCCPSCGKDLPKLHDLFVRYQNFFRLMNNAGEGIKVRFRISNAVPLA